jgi:hypothetical protein
MKEDCANIVEIRELQREVSNIAIDLSVLKDISHKLDLLHQKMDIRMSYIEKEQEEQKAKTNKHIEESVNVRDAVNSNSKSILDIEKNKTFLFLSVLGLIIAEIWKVIVK